MEAKTKLTYCGKVLEWLEWFQCDLAYILGNLYWRIMSQIPFLVSFYFELRACAFISVLVPSLACDPISYTMKYGYDIQMHPALNQHTISSKRFSLSWCFDGHGGQCCLTHHSEISYRRSIELNRVKVTAFDLYHVHPRTNHAVSPHVPEKITCVKIRKLYPRRKVIIQK